jgi:hypothetical protein
MAVRDNKAFIVKRVCIAISMLLAVRIDARCLVAFQVLLTVHTIDFEHLSNPIKGISSADLGGLFALDCEILVVNH